MQRLLHTRLLRPRCGWTMRATCDGQLRLQRNLAVSHTLDSAARHFRRSWCCRGDCDCNLLHLANLSSFQSEHWHCRVTDVPLLLSARAPCS